MKKLCYTVVVVLYSDVIFVYQFQNSNNVDEIIQDMKAFHRWGSNGQVVERLFMKHILVVKQDVTVACQWC